MVIIWISFSGDGLKILTGGLQRIELSGRYFLWFFERESPD